MIRFKRTYILIISLMVMLITGCSNESDAKPEESTASVSSEVAAVTPSSDITPPLPPENSSNPITNLPSQHLTPVAFLQTLDYKVEQSPAKFTIAVPDKWEVKQGDYPIGLYWSLVNEFSKDADLDLTALKGSTVQVWRYTLTDGLPGEGSQAEYTYPSTMVLLVKTEQVVGAWLEFNHYTTAGPSIKKHSLTDITGLAFDEWADRERLLSDPGENGDLASLRPTDLLTAYYQAIDEGNLTRVNACLSPRNLAQSLSMNIGENMLYNPGFADHNTQSGGIQEVKSISFKYLDENNTEMKQIGDRTEIKIEALLDLKATKNNPVIVDGIQPRFVGLKKLSTGWKITGSGSGP